MKKATWSAARLVRNNNAILQHVSSNANSGYSPSELLSQFNQSSASALTVKRASKHQNRFFMYEEHGPVKLHDDQGATQTISAAPNELSKLLHTNDANNNDDDFHYYWTSPIASVAPHILAQFQPIQQHLHPTKEEQQLLLDPRGPSLWMGTSGSGTQCHYDVANNIIVQLYGSKRIRIYPPSVGVYNLHVFPDAHPRARKSQVDFDKYYGGMELQTQQQQQQQIIRQQFPHFDKLPMPILDVILRPGDAIEIPAFWFHHVENGRFPSSSISKQSSPTNNIDFDGGDDGPSVSLNSFVLSQPMMIAQQIFQKASRPLGPRSSPVSPSLVPAILKSLGVALIRGLDVVVDCGSEEEFIRQYLLNARYDPLEFGKSTAGKDTGSEESNTTTQQSLNDAQLRAIKECVERILPDFQDLMFEGEDDRNGIALLVALHLLELWAVEFVGASSVAKAWDDALIS